MCTARMRDIIFRSTGVQAVYWLPLGSWLAAVLKVIRHSLFAILKGAEMNPILSRAIGAGAFFLFIFLSGFWLSRSGKPYSTMIFTIHKLIGLAAGIFLIVIVYRSYQAAPLGAPEIAAIGVTVLLFVTTVAAGGLASIDRAMPAIALRLHQIVPYAAVLSTAATLYLLLSH
jgi:hypothetical protein